MQRVEILPFHKLGAFKYEALGVRFPLDDTPTSPQLRSRTSVSECAPAACLSDAQISGSDPCDPGGHTNNCGIRLTQPLMPGRGPGGPLQVRRAGLRGDRFGERLVGAFEVRAHRLGCGVGFAGADVVEHGGVFPHEPVVAEHAPGLGHAEVDLAEQ